MASSLPKLRAFRKRHRMSYRHLGDELGVAGMTVYRWETGERRVQLRLLSKLCEITGLTFHDLRPDLRQFERFREASSPE